MKRASSTLSGRKSRAWRFGPRAEAPAFRLLGDGWALSILVAALDGVDRFEQMGELLGVARNVLSDRLVKLVALGLLERVAYSQRPPRYRYAPTSRARAFEAVLKAAVTWSDEAYADT